MRQFSKKIFGIFFICRFQIKLFHFLMKNVKTLFLIFLLSMPFLLHGQSETLIIETRDTFYVYHIHLNQSLSNDRVKIYMFDDYPHIKAKESNYVNGKLSGIERTYYPSGAKYQTFVYVDGKLWGEYRQYAEDGTQLVRGNFVNDVEHGLWIDKITGCTGRFKNGKKQGRWRCNEGKVPYKLYVYRKGELIRSVQK